METCVTFRAVYLQRSYSMNKDPLRGRLLFERIQADSVECRLGYMVRDYGDPYFPGDVVSPAELADLRPDLIFVEGGLIEGGQWRIPAEVIENEVIRGAVVIVSDLSSGVLSRQWEAYRPFLKMCQVSVKENEPGTPVELFDPRSHHRSERCVVVDPAEVIREPWLDSVYDDLEPFVAGYPVALNSWTTLVASCNPQTTQALVDHGGFVAPEPDSGVFAAARRMGSGYLVFIGAEVSGDSWARAFPATTEWLVRLSARLVDRVRTDIGRHGLAHQVFISHRHDRAEFASAFANGLRRGGVGAWLDARELAPGDELTPEIQAAIGHSSHFVLLWSDSCVDSEWIRLETEFAATAGKPMLIIRLDETPLPPELEHQFRIEAQGMSPHQTARHVTLTIERQATTPTGETSRTGP